MGAHPNTFRWLSTRLRETHDPARRDELLDMWLRARDYATEWDADQWGLPADTWTADIIAIHNQETDPR